MSRMNSIRRAGAIAALSASGLFFTAATGANAAANDYRFELARTPATKMGVSTVLIRLLHVPDRKPVSGAVFFQTRADMGPEQMAAMTAPVKAVPAAQPGVYAFEIQNGMMWKKRGKWALTLAAKVQGETDTVRGTVNLDLNP